MSSLSIKPPVLKKPSDHARHVCRACRSSGMYFTGLRMQVTIRADMSARRTLLPPVYQQSTGRCETKSIPSLANGRIITKQIMSFGKRKHPGETSSRNPQSQSAFPSWEGGGELPVWIRREVLAHIQEQVPLGPERHRASTPGGQPLHPSQVADLLELHQLH